MYCLLFKMPNRIPFCIRALVISHHVHKYCPSSADVVQKSQFSPLLSEAAMTRPKNDNENVAREARALDEL